jgi:hypothetical protein
MNWQPFSITGVLTAASVNLLYPGGPISSATRPAVGWQPAGEITALVTHIRLMNNDGTQRTVSLAIGSTAVAPSATNAAFFPLAFPIAAASPADWFGEIVLHGGNANHYLVGLASLTNVVTYMIEGEIGVA